MNQISKAILALAMGFSLIAGAQQKTIAHTAHQVNPQKSFGVTLAPMVTGTGFTQVDFNWQYNAGGVPICNGVLQNCYDGFVLTNTTTGAVLANQTVIGPTSLSWNWIPGGALPYGTISFSLVAHGYNGSGQVVTSPPATTSVANNVTSLNPPTGFVSAEQ